MTIKVYTSGICGSQEVRKQQQRVLFILQSLPIDLQIIDVTEPEREDDLIFMQENAKKQDKKSVLPPQIFNDNIYCGDYTDFEVANDDDEIMKFLKLEEGISKNGIPSNTEETFKQNGIHNGVVDSMDDSSLINTEDNVDMEVNPFIESESRNTESDDHLVKDDGIEKLEINSEDADENNKEINERADEANIVSNEAEKNEDEESE